MKRIGILGAVLALALSAACTIQPASPATTRPPSSAIAAAASTTATGSQAQTLAATAQVATRAVPVRKTVGTSRRSTIGLPSLFSRTPFLSG